jgi:hypothetical protein
MMEGVYPQLVGLQAWQIGMQVEMKQGFTFVVTAMRR